jgi:ribosomal protein L11 methyltransferase
VFANILAAPLIELEPVLSAACRPMADIFLSGLLRSQADAVKAAYGVAFDIVQVIERGDWCGIHARRNS